MRALRYYGQRDVRLEDIPEPALKPGWVKIAPAYVGICGTDLHEFLGGHNLIPRPGHPHVLTGETSPVTLGHEFSGVVVAVGEGVADLDPGQHVCVQPIIFCGHCHSCRHGLPNCCADNGFVGLSGWGGALADRIVVPRDLVWKLPASVSLKHGALVEPLATSYHAVDLAPLAHPIPADTVILILGGGPIGLAAIQAILVLSDPSAGPPCIVVSEPSVARQRFARQFGARHVFNPRTTPDLVGAVRGLTAEGRGVDVVFDCAGAQAGLDQALRCVRARGAVVNVAIWERRATLDMYPLVFREVVYMGAATYGHAEFGLVIAAMADGRLRPDAMITRVIALEDVVDEGFRALVEEKDTQVKILVDVGRGRRGEEQKEQEQKEQEQEARGMRARM